MSETTDPTAGERDKASLKAAGRLIDELAIERGRLWRRIASVERLADEWQAEVEDDGDGLTSLEGVLADLRAALAVHPLPTARAEPDAGDVEALAKVLRSAAPGSTQHVYDTEARAILASDWLDAERRKAGDERAERIAQAIEAEEAIGFPEIYIKKQLAARIARESR